MIADFAKLSTIEDYKKNILAQISDIDVAMVFLNAGMIHRGHIANIEDNKLEDIIRTNALHPIYLCKVMLN